MKINSHSNYFYIMKLLMDGGIVTNAMIKKEQVWKLLVLERNYVDVIFSL